jgi:glycerophosphoryl diester phosphodiesterase
VARPLVVGHQGSSEGVVPGSLEAYEAALAAGVEMVEVDVRRTADGELLAYHDPDVGGVPVGALSAAGVRAAAGGRVAAVAEVAALAAGAGRRLMVDLKDVGGEAEAVDVVLARLGPERVVVSTMEDESVARLRRERPELEVGLSIGREWRRPYLRTRLSEAFPVGRARAADASFLSVNRRLLPSGVLGRTLRAGLPVYLWTVDEERELRRWLVDERLRGVITNRPRRALELQLGLRR